jgi:hypothetical protein
MLWMFQRGDESLRLETRFDNETADYLLIIHRPDGTQEIERFKDALTFGNRLNALEKQLDMEHWNTIGSPVLLRDGWRI